MNWHYPTDFAWSEYVPDDVGLLGGLDFDIPVEFDAWADYNIDKTSALGADASGKFSILGQEIEWDGGMAGNFNEAFEFQQGTASMHATTSFDLPEKGYSKTFIVYGVPVTAAVDLGGNVEVFVNGSATVNTDMEFSTATVAPGTTITGEVTVSVSAVFGLAEVGATGEPAVTIVITMDYAANSGTSTTWSGLVVVPINVYASVFWGLGSADVYETELGPWEFGNGPSLLENSMEQSTSILNETSTAPDLLSTCSIAADTENRQMVVWIADTDPVPDSVDPDVFYRYFDGETWGAAAPVTAGINQFWEMDPEVVFLPEGKALAVWTSNDGEKTLADLNDIFACQDIAWSLWDGASWSEPAYIIDDTEGDGTAALVYDEVRNRIIAVWMHDANTDGNINTRTEWQLLYSVFNPLIASWSAPSPLPGTNTGEADFMPALASDGHGHILATWVSDADGVFYEELQQVAAGTNVDRTNNDCDVLVSKWDGTSWATPETLTDPNAESEVMPDIGFSNNGTPVSVWVGQDGTLEKLYFVSENISGWSVPDVILQSDKFIETPQICSGNKSSLVWVKNDLSSKTDYASTGFTDGVNFDQFEYATDFSIVFREYRGYDGDIVKIGFMDGEPAWTPKFILTDDQYTDWRLSVASVTAMSIPGDVNGDDKVDVLDITRVIKIILGRTIDTPGADVNYDGKVNVLDITAIIRKILGLE